MVETTVSILPCTQFAMQFMQNIRFGDRLAEALMARKLTQYQLARRLDVSQSSVSRWLTHRTIPRSLALRKLADELAVSHTWLLLGNGEKEKARISAHESEEVAIGGSSPSDMPSRYPGGAAPEKAFGTSTEEAAFQEMRASLRLVIGDLTDQQIIARLHEMLEDRKYSMSHRLTLVQALLSELQGRHQWV